MLEFAGLSCAELENLLLGLWQRGDLLRRVGGIILT